MSEIEDRYEHAKIEYSKINVDIDAAIKTKVNSSFYALLARR